MFELLDNKKTETKLSQLFKEGFKFMLAFYVYAANTETAFHTIDNKQYKIIEVAYIYCLIKVVNNVKYSTYIYFL